MPDFLTFDTPVWEIVLRGSAAYLTLTAILRLIPKRHIGNMSPNDVIALVIVGALVADAIIGDSQKPVEIMLMALVVLLWDYLFNLVEFHFPRVSRVTQASPTLLIYNGHLLEQNLDKEKLTVEELKANLRKHGIEDIEQVKLAILESDGHISVIEQDR
jgi:uncharacterized membrane protein YcaP (DUF421 family)